MNWSVRSQLLVLVTLLSLTNAHAQLRRREGGTRVGLIVRTAISPEGDTLAIARSSRDIGQRLGLVELCDVTTGNVRLTIDGFDGPVWGVSFSPDGKTVLTASTELREEKIVAKGQVRSDNISSVLKFWDAKNGDFKHKVTLPGEARRSLETAWSSDGKLALIERFTIVTGYISQIRDSAVGTLYRPAPGWSSRENLNLLSAETGESEVKVKDGSESYTFYQSHFGFERPVFSPDGTIVAAISSPEVRIWNSRTGDKLKSFKNLRGQPNAIEFSPDSRTLAIASIRGDKGSYNTEITIWDVASAALVKQLSVKRNLVSSLQFIRDGKTLLFGGVQYEPERTVGTVKLWELATNDPVSLNVNEGESVSFVKLLPNQNAVVLQTGYDVEVRDAQSWRVRYRLVNRNINEPAKKSRYLLSVKTVASIAFSADGSTLVAQIPEEGLKIWETRTGGVKNQRVPDGADSLVAVSSDGKVFSSFSNNLLNIWKLGNDSNNSILVEGSSSASVLALSRSGEQFALAAENEISLWLRDSSKTLRGHTAPVELLAFADNEQTLVSVDELGEIRVWDTTNGHLKSEISTGVKPTALAVDAKAEVLAIGSEDLLVSTWDARTAKLLSRFKKHEDRINALAFQPGSRLLASGGDDRTVVVWDLASGKSKHVLKGHDLTVSSIAFSPDGKTLGTGGGNAAVVLWNAASGKLERVLR